MEKVQVHVDLASDGSGWHFSTDFGPREAYVYKTPKESIGYGEYQLIVPVEDEELWDENIDEHQGIRGLLLPNVWEPYIRFET